MTINFGIVTPTINRKVLLKRHLRRAIRQTYPHWNLLVVHDGPNPSIRPIVRHFNDERISYVETRAPAKDAGVTPRLEGVRQFFASGQPIDYVVFWDDDNLYDENALLNIAASLDRHQSPDVLLVRVKYRNRTIPLIGVDIRDLSVGEIDTASFVFRPLLAGMAYEAVQRRALSDRDSVIHFNDFLAYDFVKNLNPACSVVFDPDIVVCHHDGLRWGPFIRSALRLPPMHLARRVGLGR